ncbi:hypothetical protein ACFP81_07960 [Deinococcus lacus]|uniref:Uncharacterized protein n=1 Tax=Deinococcus lacus TaxID=392561 RepID=A0ABW1YCB4_9DEIO
MKKLLLTALLFLVPSAQSLQMMVWDRDLETKLGYGQTRSGRMEAELVENYTGPVVVLFSTDGEAEGPQYDGLKSRYEGTLDGGKLLLKVGNSSQSLGRFLDEYKLPTSVTFRRTK